jgi:hypothetical protein
MEAATTQELTLHLPRQVVEMIHEAATERHETPDQIVAEALWFSLHPVRQEALRRLKNSIREQQSQSEPEIRAHLESGLDEEEQQQLSKLLERNRTEGLTVEEQVEMQRLFDRIEAVATEKAAAIWLLSGKSSDPVAS